MVVLRCERPHHFPHSVAERLLGAHIRADLVWLSHGDLVVYAQLDNEIVAFVMAILLMFIQIFSSLRSLTLYIVTGKVRWSRESGAVGVRDGESLQPWIDR